MLANIKEKLSLVPELPGSYQMKDINNTIIYVGKAKNLKRRLKSYFTKTQTGKTLMLVNDIVDFEYIVTSSELESLILEITLIKKYDPKYNILLKDDKTYPYIEFINDKCPSLKVVRNVNKKKNKNKLFGPFPNVRAARSTVDIINRLYPLKKCKNFKKDLCLYYHINECLGYCCKNVDSTYVENMNNEIIRFLQGDSSLVIDKLNKRMNDASEKLDYEKALEYKNMMDNINITLSKQKMDLKKNYNFDLFAYYNDKNYMSIVVFYIRNGLLFGNKKDIINVVDDFDESFLEYIITFYSKNNILPKEIIVSTNINDLLQSYLNVKVSCPQKGDIKKLVDLAYSNAKIYLEENFQLIKNKDEERINAINELKELLNMDKLYRIEAFDNSHLFGTFYVAGMVVFDNFLPNKNLYRKYKISTDVKDDLSAMKEVIYRRYYKSLMENVYVPDLIVVDGGELQVNVAKEIINSLNLNIKIIGLKKNDKHRTYSLIDENLNEIFIDNKSNLFLFLTRIQDEVHNYAINYHRNIKGKGMLSSFLDSIDGIGEVRKKELLKKFGSLKKLKDATIDELEKVLPDNVAKQLFEYLKNN